MDYKTINTVKVNRVTIKCPLFIEPEDRDSTEKTNMHTARAKKLYHRGMITPYVYPIGLIKIGA